MKELSDLVARFDPQWASWGKLSPDTFTLENGSAQLGAYFSNVALYRYPDALVVTDAGLLVDYILSARSALCADQQSKLAMFVEQALKGSTGSFRQTIGKISQARIGQK